MGSQRLPGKVLADLGGLPLLEHVYRRTRGASSPDAVVVATGDDVRNGSILAWARAAGVEAFLGPEDDVLTRFVWVAAATRADVVVRVSADCPLVDPDGLDRTVARHLAGGDELTHNKLLLGAPNGYPDGTGVEVMSRELLHRMHSLAVTADDREHVTKLAFHTGGYAIGIVDAPAELVAPWARLAVDTQEDLERLRFVYDRLYQPGVLVPLHATLALLGARAARWDVCPTPEDARRC